MELFEVIKFEGDDKTLVYKYPKEDFNSMSQLIVHESQEAILYKDGQALDLFGPGKYTLKTENIPLLNKIINIPTDGESPFHCEVYFINKAIILNAKWGTSSQFTILDPMFNIPLRVGACGSMEIRISDSRKMLINVIGTQNYLSTEKFIEYFKEKVTIRVKTYLAKIMSEVNYLLINQHLEEISNALKEKLNLDFNSYGINLYNFYLTTIYIPEENTQKVNEVLNKKLEYVTLDYNWKEEQLAEIAKKYADNPGVPNDMTNLITQIPLAYTLGQMLNDNIKPTLNNFFDGNSKKEENETLTDVKYCSNCGKKLKKEDKYCSNCGKKID